MDFPVPNTFSLWISYAACKRIASTSKVVMAAVWPSTCFSQARLGWQQLMSIWGARQDCIAFFMHQFWFRGGMEHDLETFARFHNLTVC